VQFRKSREAAQMPLSLQWRGERVWNTRER
jgi:hypothetical protein